MADNDLMNDGIVTEGDNEQFRLPDGTMVGTGNLLVKGGPPKLFAPFPDSLMLEDREIDRLLKTRNLEAQRKKRRKTMQNQGQVGSCNARMVVGGYYQIAEGSGHKIRPLAPEHLYMKINGGVDMGSALIRGFKEMMTGGCAGYGLVPFESFRRSQVRDIAAADKDGLRARIHEPYLLPKDYKSYVRAFASAVARGYPIMIAWHVGAGSMRLDGKGFCIVGRGAGNHASFIHEGIWIGGQDIVHGDLNNSWGPTEDLKFGPKTGGWGEGGFGKITLQNLFATTQYHDHYVLTSIHDDPQGDNPL